MSNIFHTWLKNRYIFNPTIILKTINKPGPGTVQLTRADCAGTIINNLNQAAETTLVLPEAQAGLNVIFVISTPDVKLNLAPHQTLPNQIYLEDATLSAGDKVSLDLPVIGNRISFFTFPTGALTYAWSASGAGLWYAGGAV